MAWCLHIDTNTMGFPYINTLCLQQYKPNAQVECRIIHQIPDIYEANGIPSTRFRYGQSSQHMGMTVDGYGSQGATPDNL